MIRKLLIAVAMLVATSAQGAENASCSAPEYKQFDFWVGNWEAFDRNGKLVFEARPGRELEPVLTCEDKILADNPADAWPFFVGEYPKIEILDKVPLLKKQE